MTPDGKAVQGMCLGAVFVLGGVGMAVSQVSSAYPNLCKLITGWVKTSLPEDFPFSSLQINYNYAARKHVDGNNIGPSYIRSLGKHTGGNRGPPTRSSKRRTKIPAKSTSRAAAASRY